MIRRRGLALVVALGLPLIPVARAHADGASPSAPPQSVHQGSLGVSELQAARELFAEAESDEKAGAWALALGKMQRVGQIKMTPGIRVHIAVCEEHLGHLVAALGEYALADAQAQAENNREVQRLIREPLEALQARVPRVVLRVPPDVRGLTVALDGKPLVAGVLGMAMPVDERAHEVHASAPGFQAFRASFVGKERERVEVIVRLEPLSSSEEPAAEERRSRRTAAIFATAGAVVLAGGGVGAFLVAAGKQSDARDACARAVTCDSMKSGVRAWDTLALASWIGAGAAAALAVVLWTSPGGGKKLAPAAVVLGPGSARLEGSF